MAPKGQVCVLGGWDVFDSSQQVASFLLLLCLQLFVCLFLSDEPKSINQGEKHYNPKHVELIQYTNGVTAQARLLISEDKQKKK